MSDSLEGKVAFVTGAAGGIGCATAEAMVDAGARVVISDLDDAALNALAGRLGSAAHPVATDVRSTEGVAAAVAAAIDAFGRLDIVFNNAGIARNGALVDHSDEVIDDLLAINLRAAILVSRAAIPHLLANRGGGVIINNASNGGVVGRASDPVYCATKHGLVGLTKSLALAHAEQGLRVNAVCPGPIDTPMIWGLVADAPHEQAERKIVATCPDPRLADPSEVAALVTFLATDAARFINGVAIPIDGAKAAGVMGAQRYSLDFELARERSDRA